MSNAYSEADVAIHRDFSAGSAGGAATTAYAKFRTFRRAKLKNVHACVTVAGTSTAHKFDVYIGTSSVGSIAVGTTAAGSMVSAVPLVTGGLDQVIDGTQQVTVKTGADATGTADIVYEYLNLHDGTTTK